jgi:hypothetical protein
VPGRALGRRRWTRGARHLAAALAAGLAALAASAPRLAHAQAGRVADAGGSGRATATFGDGISAPGAALERCVGPARAHLARLGARPAAALDVGFGWQGASRVIAARSVGEGCVGFLALGREGVVDLDLLLYDDQGTLLAQDRAADATPYVRACVRGGVDLRLVVTTHAGVGEHGVLRVDAAPEGLSGIERLVGACAAPRPGGAIPAPDLGPEPTEESVETALDRDLAAESEASNASAAGVDRAAPSEARARVVAGPVVRPLEERTGAEIGWSIVSDTCYVLLARHGADAHEVDVALATAAGVPLGRATTSGGRVRVAFCTPREGGQDLRVRLAMRSGHGAVALALVRLPTSEETRAFEGAVRARHAEAAAALGARSLQARPLAWAHLRPGRWLSLPLPVKAGRCVAATAVSIDARPLSRLRVALSGDDGRLLASASAGGADLGVPGPAGRDGEVAYACVARDERLRVLVSARDGSGRALVWVGEERGP